MEQEGYGDTNDSWSTRYGHQGTGAGTGGFESKTTIAQIASLQSR